MARKRGKSEGTVFERPDGRWQARASFGYAEGRRDRRSFYGRTRLEAIEKMSEAIEKHRRGELTKSDRRTVGAFLAEWLERKRGPGGVRPLTAEQYAQHIRLYLAPQRTKADRAVYKPLPALGGIRLDRLAPEHVQAFMTAQLKVVSPRTAQLSLVILRGALDSALKFGLVSRNAGKLVDLPRVKRTRVTPLDPEQTRKLVLTLKDDRLEALYVVALALGIRRGACLGMRWRDLDLDAGTYNIGTALAVQRIGRPGACTPESASSLQLVEQKTETNRPAMPLPEIVVKSLKARHAAQLRERVAYGPTWVDNDLVFTTRKGTAIEPRRIHRNFKELLAKADLPPATRFHDLRHGVASLLIALGEHPRVVMEWLGHSQISITMNSYSHVMPTAMRDVAGKLDAILSQTD